MLRVLALLGGELRIVKRGETATGVLPPDERDAWLSRIRRLLRGTDTRSLAQMLTDDDLSPSTLRHDRATLERVIADRLARGGWRLATGTEERSYILPSIEPEESDGGESESEGESFSVSFYVDADPRYIDAEIHGELDPEHFEVALDGELEPEHFEVELEGELVPAPIRGWILGGELEEDEEDEEQAQANVLSMASKEGAPFCEECARAAAADAAAAAAANEA